MAVRICRSAAEAVVLAWIIKLIAFKVALVEIKMTSVLKSNIRAP